MSLNDLSDPWFNQHVNLADGSSNIRNLHDALNWTDRPEDSQYQRMCECGTVGLLPRTIGAQVAVG